MKKPRKTRAGKAFANILLGPLELYEEFWERPMSFADWKDVVQLVLAGLQWITVVFAAITILLTIRKFREDRLMMIVATTRKAYVD